MSFQGLNIFNGASPRRYVLKFPYWGWIPYAMSGPPSHEFNTLSDIVSDDIVFPHLVKRHSLEQPTSSSYEKALTRVMMNNPAQTSIFESPQHFLRENAESGLHPVNIFTDGDGNEMSLIGFPVEFGSYKRELRLYQTDQEMLSDSALAAVRLDSLTWELSSSEVLHSLRLILTQSNMPTEIVLVDKVDGSEEVVDWQPMAEDTTIILYLSVLQDPDREWLLRIRGKGQEPLRVRHDYLLGELPSESGFARGGVATQNVSVNVRRQPGTTVSLRVIPQPATDKLVVELPTLVQDSWNVSVVDITGRELLRAVGVSSFHEFDVSGLPVGSYLLKATSIDHSVARTVIIHR
jgi:hypothetical protein